MAIKQRVTQGEDLEVDVQDIHDSDYGSLIAARQQLFPTERRDIMLTRWISQEKASFIRKTGREWSYFTSDSTLKEDAFTTIIHMVGIRVLRRAQNARVQITDTDYRGQIIEVDKIIDHNILNFQDPESDVSVSNVEPDLVDPDADYSYNT
jgi:hypothetical protein